MTSKQSIQDFLQPLIIDLDLVQNLSVLFAENFAHLAAESQTQFLPTPISDAILRPAGEHGRGRYLAIDIGGTNLRVGFVELRGKDVGTSNGVLDIVHCSIEKSWPIDDQLKNGNADNLFRWIGRCIADVVREGCQRWTLPNDQPLHLGVSFSFPMLQSSISQAKLMGMGKGFAVTKNTDIGSCLLDGYNYYRNDLPPIEVAAIANDSVSTLVSFIFKFEESARRKACMGLILGTGCNATIPLKLSVLHPEKRPSNISILPGENIEEIKIAINTEWSINGSAPPLRETGLVTRWDQELDSNQEIPGFQPLEYMTSGRYLGELGRIVALDYMTNVLGISKDSIPSRLLQRHGLTTTFLSCYKPLEPRILLTKLRHEYPETGVFSWTEDLASAIYHIAKALQVRAAGIVSAAIVGLLSIAGEVPVPGSSPPEPRGLGVGYTGGCIVHFQDYLADTKRFLDKLMERRFGSPSPIEIEMSPCHDGGVTGAGLLVAAASSSKNAKM